MNKTALVEVALFCRQPHPFGTKHNHNKGKFAFISKCEKYIYIFVILVWVLSVYCKNTDWTHALTHPLCFRIPSAYFVYSWYERVLLLLIWPANCYAWWSLNGVCRLDCVFVLHKSIPFCGRNRGVCVSIFSNEMSS